VIRDALAGEHGIAERDRLAHHRGARRPSQEAAPIEFPRRGLRERRGLLRRRLRRLLLIAGGFFSQIRGEILVVLLRHLRLAPEVDLFGGERRLGLCLALDLELHFRKLDVSHRLFEFRLAPVGHGPAPPLPELQLTLIAQ